MIGQPFLQKCLQSMLINGFGEVIIHPCGDAFFLCPFHGVCGGGDNDWPMGVITKRMNFSRRFEAIHIRHLAGIIDSSESQTLGVRAHIALYEAGATRSRKREAKYASKRREYQKEDVENAVVRDVTVSWYDFHTSRALMHSREQEVEVAQKALEGVREEAKMGQRSILNMLDADEELIEAETAFTRAKYNHILSYLTLLKSAGTLGKKTL